MLSVVLPTYGVEQYLKACLDSVLKIESLLEIIVVIDCSPDGSAAIAEQFKRLNEKIRIIYNEENQGLGASRNIGFNSARGKYVMFADSDDLLVAETIDEMVLSLEGSGSSFATAPANEFGRGSGLQRYWTTDLPIFREGGKRLNLITHPELVCDHTAWTKVYNAEFWKNNNLEWAEGVKCEDIRASTRAYSLAEGVDVVPKICYLYRRRPGSITTNLGESRTIGDWARETEKTLGYLEPSSAAIQCALNKIYKFELQSRLDIASKVCTPSDLQAFESCLAAIMELSSPHLVEAQDPILREKILGYRWKNEELDPIHPSKSSIEPHEGVEPDTTNPVVSIVMPTYNVAEWVGDTIRSILSQKLQSLELIVVDDFSTDSTWEIVGNFAENDPRIKLMRNPGSGGAQARNFGVKEATGTFLTFADGDDLVPEFAYQCLSDKLLSTGSDMVVGDFQKFWPTSTWRNSEAFGLNVHTERTSLKDSPRLIRNRTCWNRMFRRSFWNINGIHFPTTPRANDIQPMTLAMVLASSIDIVSEVVYHYRARSGESSMTAKLGKPDSIIGYFQQESICARIVGSQECTLRDDFWQNALGQDGWGNLGNYLRSYTPNQDQTIHREVDVSEAVGRLWEQIPVNTPRLIGPWKTLCFLAAATGRIATAKTLYEAEKVRRTKQTSLKVSRSLLDLAKEKKYQDQILSVFHDAVLRPLLDDPSEWDASIVSEIIENTCQLSEWVDLREATVPETREPRLLELMLAGDENKVWKFARNRERLEPCVLELTELSRSRMVFNLRLRTSLTPIFMLLIESEVPKQARRVFPVVVENGKVEVDEDLFKNLRGAKWSATLEFVDDFGLFTVPCQINSQLDPTRLSSIRIASNKLQVLFSGSERAKRALTWRKNQILRRYDNSQFGLRKKKS